MSVMDPTHCVAHRGICSALYEALRACNARLGNHGLSSGQNLAWHCFRERWVEGVPKTGPHTDCGGPGGCPEPGGSQTCLTCHRKHSEPLIWLVRPGVLDTLSHGSQYPGARLKGTQYSLPEPVLSPHTATDPTKMQVFPPLLDIFYTPAGTRFTHP